MASTEDQPHAEAPGTVRPEDYPYRVLLSAPDARTIPVFALGAEAGRDAHDVKVNSGLEALSRATSGNVSRALVRGRYGEHRLINTRRRICQRTALYSSWLAFPELVQAETFIRDHPRFGLRVIETRTQAKHMKCETDLRTGAETGRYDLGSLEHRARLNRAREYVRISEELDKLAWSLWAFQKLKESLVTTADGVPVG